MAKGGKFTKLMKKLSFGKTSRTSSFESVTGGSSSLQYSDANSLSSTSSLSTGNSIDDNNNNNNKALQIVYVGKTRRRYLLTSDVVAHPIFRQLAGKADGGDEITVGCEVVLFEHLLWMLENADPMPESLDELAEFYAC